MQKSPIIVKSKSLHSNTESIDRRRSGASYMVHVFAPTHVRYQRMMYEVVFYQRVRIYEKLST